MKPETTLCRECGKDRVLSPDGICIPCYDKSKTTQSVAKHEVIMWDWRERIDLDHLNDAIKNVFDGCNAPRIHQVDTGQDCYAIVVGSADMTKEQVQAAWEADEDED
jgi:hypothetical protein